MPVELRSRRHSTRDRTDLSGALETAGDAAEDEEGTTG
jgi:hypothetical protein